jgi:hypothetical protein
MPLLLIACRFQLIFAGIKCCIFISEVSEVGLLSNISSAVNLGLFSKIQTVSSFIMNSLNGLHKMNAFWERFYVYIPRLDYAPRVLQKYQMLLY